MAMRETPGSLRAYFFLAGALGALSVLRDVKTAADLGTSLAAEGAVVWLPMVVRVALSIGFIIAALRLPTALQTGARWIQQLLVGALAVQVANMVLIAAVIPEVLPWGLIGSLVALAITGYLLASVRRLAAEAVARAVPPARLV